MYKCCDKAKGDVFCGFCSMSICFDHRGPSYFDGGRYFICLDCSIREERYIREKEKEE